MKYTEPDRSIPNYQEWPTRNQPCPYCGKKAAVVDGYYVNKLTDGTVVRHQCVRSS